MSADRTTPSTRGATSTSRSASDRISVVFLVHRPDYAGGTERATFLVTGALAHHPRLDVSIVGLERTAAEPFFADDVRVPLTTLVDIRDPDVERQPSALVEHDWQSDFSTATDAALAEWFDRVRPDIVVATTPGLLAVADLLAPATTRIVDVEHRSSAARGGSGVPLHRHGPSADALVSLSEEGTDWWRSELGEGRVDGPVLATIPNPLPLQSAPRSALRRPVVFAAGRMVRSKQFDVIVEAFARARRDGWRLRVVGEGPDAGRVRATVRRLGVCDHVDLISSLPDLSTELAKASIHVMASRAEGQPLVAMEAQRAGVPVVAYDCPGGTSSIVTHGRNGLLVELDDLDALAAALRTLIDDVELRQRMGAAAWVDRHRFAPDLVARQWADPLLDLASRPSRRSRR